MPSIFNNNNQQTSPQVAQQYFNGQRAWTIQDLKKDIEDKGMMVYSEDLSASWKIVKVKSSSNKLTTIPQDGLPCLTLEEYLGNKIHTSKGSWSNGEPEKDIMWKPGNFKDEWIENDYRIYSGIQSMESSPKGVKVKSKWLWDRGNPYVNMSFPKWKKGCCTQENALILKDCFKLCIKNVFKGDTVLFRHYMFQMIFKRENILTPTVRGWVFQGDMGAGKGWITIEIPQIIFGNNFGLMGCDTLTDFNGPVEGLAFLCLNEGKIVEDKIIELIKNMTADHFIMINEKNVKEFKSWFNGMVVISSNDPLPIKLTPDNRRFFVVLCDKDYFVPTNLANAWENLKNNHKDQVLDFIMTEFLCDENEFGQIKTYSDERDKYWTDIAERDFLVYLINKCLWSNSTNRHNYYKEAIINGKVDIELSDTQKFEEQFSKVSGWLKKLNLNFYLGKREITIGDDSKKVLGLSLLINCKEGISTVVKQYFEKENEDLFKDTAMEKEVEKVEKDLEKFNRKRPPWNETEEPHEKPKNKWDDPEAVYYRSQGLTEDEIDGLRTLDTNRELSMREIALKRQSEESQQNQGGEYDKSEEVA